MSKAVLMSIQPKWCELIASGKKTIEVRKTEPKFDVPFKVYIYCTKGNLALLRDDGDTEEKYKYDVWEYAEFHQNCGKKILGGKVIGEFVCDEIQTIHKDDFSAYGIYDCSDDDVITACMCDGVLWDYGQGKDLYFWHISDLVIYDKPKELGEFYRRCDEGCETCTFWKKVRVNKDEYDMDCASPICEHIPITRPPQSWCYVEEKGVR